MSEHSDDAFDAMLRQDELHSRLLDLCPKNRKVCNWDRNDDGMLECSTCGKVVDE